MTDLFDQLKQKYGEVTFAEALLYKSPDGSRRSLRVEADSVGLEFTDNIYLGVVEPPPSASYIFKYLDTFLITNFFCVQIMSWL